MNRARKLVATAVLVAAVGCASVGTSDPTLVRAEDLLSNSLSIYDGAMRYHFANSTKESPQVYKILESVRTGFPPAWKALYDGTRAYKSNPASTDLSKLTGALQKMLDDLSSVNVGASSYLWLEVMPDRIGG